ncbi:MAG: integrin alpha [Planctomycetota bacterium]
MRIAQITLSLCLAAPLTVAQQVAFTIDGFAAGDGLGSAVAVLGDTNGDDLDDLLLGAPGADAPGIDAGTIRVLSGADGSTLWWRPGDAAGDRFGHAVASAGDVNGDGFADVIVGAPGSDRTALDAGSATVLSGRDGQVLHVFDGSAADDGFGWAVAGAGDVNGDGYDDVIVGAPRSDGVGADAGSAHVLSGLDGAVLHTFAGLSAGDQLGYAVAGAGDVDGDCFADLVLGAPTADNGGGDSGAVWVHSGADGSVLLQQLGANAGDQFGWSVDGVGDVDGDGQPDVAVGAPLADDAAPDAGLATVLSGADGTQLLSHFGDEPGESCGWSVRRAGDVDGDGRGDLVIGAPGDSKAGAGAGSARVVSGASAVRLHTYYGRNPGDAFGTSVGGGGTINADGFGDIIVGAPGSDDAGAESGQAEVYLIRGFDNLGLAVTHNPGASMSCYGTDVAGVGDVDNDGVPDYAVGAPFHNVDGAVWVYSGADHTVLHTFIGPNPDIFFGIEVNGAGDINQDGHADIIVGAIHEDFGIQDTGMAQVYSGADGSVLRTFYGTQFRSHMGTAVGTLGDIDGDTVDDLYVGVGLHQGETGAIWVYSGASGNRLYSREGQVQGEWFGWDAAAIEDLDGDGIKDLAVGAPSGQVRPTPGTGYVRIFSGASGTPIAELRGLNPRDRFGWVVADAGDIDADGFHDILVGADGHDLPGEIVDAGFAQVFSGRDRSLLFEFFGTTSLEDIGRAVGGAGDVNADGFDDFMIGGVGVSPGGITEAGSAFLFSGRDGSVLQRFDGVAIEDKMGASVNGIGDINFDGYPDVLVGAPGVDLPSLDAGAAEAHVTAVRPNPGSLRLIGAACPGSTGDLPRTALSGRPAVGETFVTSLRAALPGSFTLLIPGAVRLAFPLSGLGAPGCTLLANPAFVIPVPIDATGKAVFPMPVPDMVEFVGATFYFQWIIVDPTANPLGLVATDLGRVIIGTGA